MNLRHRYALTVCGVVFWITANPAEASNGIAILSLREDFRFTRKTMTGCCNWACPRFLQKVRRSFCSYQNFSITGTLGYADMPLDLTITADW
jgi:hypothetical protein